MSQNPKTTNGFTLVEVLIIAPAIILIIAGFVALIITITGDVLRTKGANDAVYNTEDALSRIDQDVGRAIQFKQTSYTLTSPQGQSDDTTAFDVSTQPTTYLVLRTVTTNKSPFDVNSQLIYKMSAGSCSTTPYTMDVVYFTKVASGITSLWRRVLQGNATDAGTPCTGTTPWQVPTCSPGYTNTTICKADDALILDNVSNLSVAFLDATGAQITNLANISTAKSANVSIGTNKTIAGRTLSYNASASSVAPGGSAPNLVLPAQSFSTGGPESCAVDNGRAYCWGQNSNYELGVGYWTRAPTTFESSPVAVDMSGVLSGKTVTDIDIDNGGGCAVASGGAYCWGDNTFGELGIGGTSTSGYPPKAVYSTGTLGGKTVTDIVVDGASTCALADGIAYCWGYGYSGRLGNGSYNDYTTPRAVDTSGVLSGKTLTAITSGYTFRCVLADGKAYCWGGNYAGGLGNGNTIDQPSPVAVDTSGVLSGKTITDISGGGSSTCAIADGKAYCWGYNNYGQLGNGSTVNQPIPVAVNTTGVLSGKTLTAIASGGNSSCAIADGKAYCWGYNGAGQLGDGTTTQSTTPVAVNTTGVLSGKTLTGITASGDQVCARTSNPATKIYCWGYNGAGQLGDGTTTNQTTPTQATIP